MNTPRLPLGVIVWMTALLSLSGCTHLHPACPTVDDILAEHLHGQWTVQLEGSGPHWSLQLGPHPEHRGSLRGELKQGALRYPVVADLDSGEFTLEESHDGQRIAATWLGEVKMIQCDWLIRGQRQWDDASRPSQSFEMRSDRLR